MVIQLKNINTYLKILFFCTASFASNFSAHPQSSNEIEKIIDNAEFFENISGKNLSDLNEIKNEDISVDANQPGLLNKKSEKFGFDFILNLPRSVSGTSDLPLPNDYKVSLGDSIRVILTGVRKDDFLVTVGLDGSVLLPELGAINVFGETLLEVKQKIQNLVEISYVGTRVSIGLSNAAAKKISIIGSVKTPGTYLVNPFTTVLSSLAYSGGFEENASLRNIKLIRGENTFFIDLYEFLIYGNRTSDITLQQGDTILVESSSNFIEISGEVLRPQIFEYKQSDSYRDLILHFAQGSTLNGDLSNIYAEKLENKSLISFSPNLDDKISSSKLKKVKLFKNAFTENLNIEIMGNGVQQGAFSLNDYDSLEGVIVMLRFSDDIYPFYANLEQNSSTSIGREKYSFSISDPETYKNIKLTKNTKIRFYSRSDIENIQQLFDEEEKKISKDVSNKKESNTFSGQIDTQIVKRITDLENKINNLALNEDQNKRQPESEIEFDYEYLGDGIFQNRADESYLTFDEFESLKDANKKKEEIASTISKKSLKNFYFSGEKKIIPLEGRISPRALIDFFGISENHKPEDSVVSLRGGQTLTGDLVVSDAADINSIYVPEIKIDTRKVTISGLVKSPGKYDVPVGTTLEDLYYIVNGFLDYADLDSIIFTRESIKKSEEKALEDSKQILIDNIFNSAGSSAITGNTSGINQLLPLINLASEIEPVGRLTGDLKPGSALSKNLVIEEGDEITIIPSRSTVTIAGQVLQPITVSFEGGLSLADYISLSGGFTKYADKNKLYLIKKNGTSVPISNRLFMMETQIMPGDTIVVPRNIERLQPIPLVSVATSIISDIAFAAASLNSIRN